MEAKQLNNVIERLKTRIPLTDNDEKFDRMIFFRRGEGVHINEYDAWIAMVMQAAETFAEILPLLEQLLDAEEPKEDAFLTNEICEIVFPDEFVQPNDGITDEKSNNNK